jgi:hypothetical protein
LEDTTAHSVLDPLDLGADRGLGKAERLGGLGDTAGFGYADHGSHDFRGNARMLVSAMHDTSSFEIGVFPRLQDCSRRRRFAKVIGQYVAS